MSAWHASLLSLALAFSGMAALAFAMERHCAQLAPAHEPGAAHAWLLRCLGVPLLLAAALPCVWAWGATVGGVAWLGFLSVGAMGCVAAISAAPRWAARLAWLLAPVAVLALAWVRMLV